MDASDYLVELATESSIYKGVVAAYESVNTRYMRLMSRYSADTPSGMYTQDLGGFAQRSSYPGADVVTVKLQTGEGSTTLTIPWAAKFIAVGNTTQSFISSCIPPSNATRRDIKYRETESIAGQTSLRRAVVRPDNQAPVRDKLASTANYVTPNLTSFGHFVTLDIYQLQDHPKVGVVYFEQFDSQDGTSFTQSGVEHILIDISGNRGGLLTAGATVLWSLWPQDLFPGFPSVIRATDLPAREAATATATGNKNSNYWYAGYRDLEYNSFTNSSQFMDPPVPQTINGVADAFSHPFLDDFGPGAIAVTNFTVPPFAGYDYVIVSNSICASMCSLFSSYLFQKHDVRSAVFGGTPSAASGQFDGGVKGSEILFYTDILFDLEILGMLDDPAAPQELPIDATFSLNFRNAIPYIDTEDGILEFVWEQGTKKYQFTHEQFNKPQKVWEFVAEEFFGQD
ncbi:hypothetical protein B0H13DRAFT_689659 [Mycena leptocephala]|nr:hypothetical protein B0H13DRAFT_689659 [Mycena leptocephala]